MRRIPQAVSLMLILAFLCFAPSLPLLAEEKLPEVGLPEAKGDVVLTKEEWQKGNWYLQDLSPAGVPTGDIWMDCGSREIRSLGPASYQNLTPQEVKEAGYINICVPVQTGFRFNKYGVQQFSGDPPVYINKDFNKIMNVIFPDTEPGWAGQDKAKFTLWYEVEDPVTGEISVEYEIATISTPNMTFVVELLDGFGQVRVRVERPITATDWTPQANVDLQDNNADRRVLALRSTLIDPRLQGKPDERWTPYRDPPMIITAGLRANGASGWVGSFYTSYGVAILVPTEGVEALPHSADLGLYIDASSGQQVLDWVPVEGAVGYKIVHATMQRRTFNPYSTFPEAYKVGRWWPDDFQPPSNPALYTTPGVPIGEVWTDVGAMGAQFGPGKGHYFVVPVGSPVESFGNLPLAGRPSRLVGAAEGAGLPVRLPDGSFRVGGPTVSAAQAPSGEHGFEAVAQNGMDTISGLGFGVRAGRLLGPGNEPLAFDRIHRWNDTLIEMSAGSELGKQLVIVEDAEGRQTPVTRDVIETVPSFKEPGRAWFIPGEPLTLDTSQGQPTPSFEFVCYDFDKGTYVAGPATVAVGGSNGSWQVTIAYEPGVTPCYHCDCYIQSPVVASDGLPMADPYWRWPMVPLPEWLGSHLVPYVDGDGEPWLHGSYGSSLGSNGVDTGNGVMMWMLNAESDLGPSPLLLREVDSIAWSFGSIGTGVLSAKDVMSISSLIERGGNVTLVGLHFLAGMANEPVSMLEERLGISGVRPVRLKKSVSVPPESPAAAFLTGEVELREECWNMVSHAPIPGPGCETVMTVTTSKGERPVVVACGEGHLLISALRVDCFWDPNVVNGWIAAMKW